MDKSSKYAHSLLQIKGVIEPDGEFISDLANICAILKENHGFFWVGFYLVTKDQLILGPFQGPVACTRIAFGKGVCGTSWQQAQTLVVKDVHEFPGHIACNTQSRSEIVVPIFSKKNEVIGVLDIDSTDLASFDNIDAQNLEQVADLLKQSHG